MHWFGDYQGNTISSSGEKQREKETAGMSRKRNYREPRRRRYLHRSHNDGGGLQEFINFTLRPDLRSREASRGVVE